MKFLKSIRTRLAATQFEMAQFFGIHTSLYSMAEGAKRDLPSDAKEKLVLLIKILNGLPEESLEDKISEETKADVLEQSKYELLEAENKLKEFLKSSERELTNHDFIALLDDSKSGFGIYQADFESFFKKLQDKPLKAKDEKILATLLDLRKQVIQAKAWREYVEVRFCV